MVVRLIFGMLRRMMLLLGCREAEKRSMSASCVMLGLRWFLPRHHYAILTAYGNYGASESDNKIKKVPSIYLMTEKNIAILFNDMR